MIEQSINYTEAPQKKQESRLCFRCRNCGNLAEMSVNSGLPLLCCGVMMERFLQGGEAKATPRGEPENQPHERPYPYPPQPSSIPYPPPPLHENPALSPDPVLPIDPENPNRPPIPNPDPDLTPNPMPLPDSYPATPTKTAPYGQAAATGTEG